MLVVTLFLEIFKNILKDYYVYGAFDVKRQVNLKIIQFTICVHGKEIKFELKVYCSSLPYHFLWSTFEF